MHQHFIPLYGWTTFHCLDPPHFATHSSTFAHLGAFHFLPIMNDGALNICVQFLMWTYVFISFGDITRHRIAESYGNFMFNILEELANCFPKWPPFYIPINHVWRFHFSTSVPVLVLGHLFWLHSHPSGFKELSHDFDSHFPNDIKHFFVCLLAYISGEMSLQIFCPHSNWIIYLFIVDCECYILDMSLICDLQFFSIDLYVCPCASTTLSWFLLLLISFEIRKWESSAFVLLKDCFGYFGPIVFPYEF